MMSCIVTKPVDVIGKRGTKRCKASRNLVAQVPEDDPFWGIDL